jgi:nucleoside-diphosphate-sugar epimerase
VLGFVRGTIKPYQGLRNLVAAFYQALGTGEPVPVGLAEASEVVGWVEKVAREADEQALERVRALEASPGAVDVLVTGASGALGSAIVERLLARGASVRCLVRRADSPLPKEAQVAVGDLGDAEAVDRAVRGAGVVVHAGAAMRGPWPAHHGATVLGTAHVIASCRKHRVARLVYVSSLSVLGVGGDESGAPVDEETRYEPHPERRGSYTRAKLEAERLVAAAVRQHGLPAVILRPGQIFGRRIPLLNAAVARRIGSHWLMLGDGDVVLPLVYIDDVVDATLLALDSDLGRGEVIHVVDNEVSLTQNDVLTSVLGDDVRPLRVPRGLTFGAGRLSELLLGALRRESPVPEYRLRSALAKHSYRSQQAVSTLGWTPRVGVRAGIELERQAGRLAPS